MKSLFIAFCLLVFTPLTFAQCCFSTNTLNYLISGGGEDYGGYNFQFYGDETDLFLDSILTKFPEMKRKNYTWTSKKVKIEGIDEEVTIKIHSGLKGRDENGSGYFHTYKNSKDKESLLSKNDDSEFPGIVIYVRNGRKNALKTKDQAEIVKEYLLSIKD